MNAVELALIPLRKELAKHEKKSAAMLEVINKKREERDAVESEAERLRRAIAILEGKTTPAPASAPTPAPTPVATTHAVPQVVFSTHADGKANVAQRICAYIRANQGVTRLALRKYFKAQDINDVYFGRMLIDLENTEVIVSQSDGFKQDVKFFTSANWQEKLNKIVTPSYIEVSQFFEENSGKAFTVLELTEHYNCFYNNISSVFTVLKRAGRIRAVEPRGKYTWAGKENSDVP